MAKRVARPPDGHPDRRGEKLKSLFVSEDDDERARMRASIATRDFVLKRLSAQFGSDVEAEGALCRCQSSGVNAAASALDLNVLNDCGEFIRAVDNLDQISTRVAQAMASQGGSPERKEMYPSLFPPIIGNLDGVDLLMQAKAGASIDKFLLHLRQLTSAIEPMRSTINGIKGNKRAEASQLAFASILRDECKRDRRLRSFFVSGRMAYLLAASCGVVAPPRDQDEVERGANNWKKRLAVNNSARKSRTSR